MEAIVALPDSNLSKIINQLALFLKITGIDEFQRLNSSRFLIFRKSRFKGNML